MWTKPFLLVVAFLAAFAVSEKGSKLTPKQEADLLKALGMRKAIKDHSESIGKDHKKDIEIPQFLKEQYELQTGLEVQTSSFPASGVHTSTANIVRSFSSNEFQTKNDDETTRFKFDFNPENYNKNNDGGEILMSAQLKVLWNPQLSIVRNHGSFKAAALDVIKAVNASKIGNKMAAEITMVLDTKKIYHRNSEVDAGWYAFDVTPAVQRWLKAKPKAITGQLEVRKGKMLVKKGSQMAILPQGQFQEAYLLVYSEDEASRTHRR